jgi:hypothetical protein
MSSMITKVDEKIYTRLNNWGSNRSFGVWTALYLCWAVGVMVLSSWLFPSHAVAPWAAFAGCTGSAICSGLYSAFLYPYYRVSHDAMNARITSVIFILAVPMIVIGAVVCAIWGSDSLIVALALPGGLGAIVGIPLFIVKSSAQQAFVTPRF